MTYFDTDGDGHINFDEFLVGVRVGYFLFLIGILGKNERPETIYG
jgi:hypothetical protein